MTQNKPEENNKQPRPGNDWEKELDNHPRFGKTWTDKNELFDYLQRDFENDIKSFIRTQIDLEHKKVIEEIKEWAKKEMKANPLHNLFDLNDYLNNLKK